MGDQPAGNVFLPNNLPFVLDAILEFVENAVPELDTITTPTEPLHEGSESDSGNENKNMQTILTERWNLFCERVDIHTKTLHKKLEAICANNDKSRGSTPVLGDVSMHGTSLNGKTSGVNAVAAKIKTKIVEAMLARLQIDTV